VLIFNQDEIKTTERNFLTSQAGLLSNI